MGINIGDRVRPNESLGKVSTLHGEFRMAAMSGLVTVAAAATTTAGHMFVMRNPSTTKSAIFRYLNANFITTTGFGALQPLAYDLIVGRTSSASYTGGTAIDVGSTLASPKLRANQATSLFTANTCRIATTAGLTAGTQTLDGMPLAQKGGLGSTAIGVAFDALLLDARDDGASVVRSPITIGPSEVLVVRNVILMGATGVGYLTINVEWDEVTI